jgi:hypothetical protein
MYNYKVVYYIYNLSQSLTNLKNHCDIKRRKKVTCITKINITKIEYANLILLKSRVHVRKILVILN